MTLNCFYNPPNTFGPVMRVITAITNANPGVVTTFNNHNYVTGTIVRLDIPEGFGMEQLNGQQVTINVLSPTTFAINLDTTLFTPFAYPTNPNFVGVSCPQSVPIGEVNSILTARVVNQLNPNF